MRQHQAPRLHRLMHLLTAVTAASACALAFTGCGDLQGLFGNTEPDAQQEVATDSSVEER